MGAEGFLKAFARLAKLAVRKGVLIPRERKHLAVTDLQTVRAFCLRAVKIRKLANFNLFERSEF